MKKPCRKVRSVAASQSLDTPSRPRSRCIALGSLLRSIALGFGMFLVAANADAIVIDFSLDPSNTPGNLGMTSLLTNGGVIVDGYYFDGGSWQGANLYRRNDDDDHGLGVCSNGEDCEAGGDFNELSNNVNPELIRLTLPAGFFWTGVGVSSLDTNSGNAIERGEAFATNDGDPNNLLPDPTALTPGAFWQFAATANSGPAVEPTFLVTGDTQFLEFIFFRPFDWSGGVVYGYNPDNDFLVWQVTIEPIPEPGTVFLLATGLLGLAVVARRRKKA